MVEWNIFKYGIYIGRTGAIKNTTVVNDDNPKYGTEGGVNTTDKVYLLSIAEACNTAYGFNGKFDAYKETREARNTAYAKECGAWTWMGTEYEGNGIWCCGDGMEEKNFGEKIKFFVEI